MEQNFNEQELLRREALGKLRDLGIEPYPAPLYPVNATAKEVKERFDPEKGELRVMVQIFGRATPVEVDLLQVEKLI